MKNRTNSTIFRLVFSALMLALGTALSFIQIPLPFGGSITLCSMVPLLIVCQLYGVVYGTSVCFAFSLIQLMLGSGNLAYGVTPLAVAVIILFDYVVAFSSMALSGLTRGMKNKGTAAAVGALIGCAARYVCHVVSGATVWKEYASLVYIPQFLHGTVITENPNVFYWAYSICYNATYMIPETIITVVAGALILRFVKFDSRIAK